MFGSIALNINKRAYDNQAMSTFVKTQVTVT